MPWDAPASPPTQRSGARWWLLPLGAGLLLLLLMYRERQRAHLVERTQRLVLDWTEDESTREALTEMALEELRARLGPEDPWCLELDQDPTLAREAGETIWSAAPDVAGCPFPMRLRLDSFSPPIDEARRSLRKTLPSIRVVDLGIRVRAEFTMHHSQGVVVLEARGGRLDAAVVAMLRAELEGQDVVIQAVELSK